MARLIEFSRRSTTQLQKILFFMMNETVLTLIVVGYYVVCWMNYIVWL